jgi:hypothetical protein
VALANEMASLSSSGLIYATTIHNIYTLTESNKELLSANKKFKKKVQEKSSR